MTEKVKLTSRPEKTATWIWLERGQLKVEYYDFSELAQRMFGNDIAYILTISEMDKLFTLAGQDKTSLISWMADHFQSYFEIKRWLEVNGIGFDREVDPRA